MTKRIEKIAGAVLFALILIVGINLGGDAVNRLVTPPAPEPPATEAPPGPVAVEAPPPAPAAEVPSEPVAPLVAAASPEAGASVAKVCKTCHTFEQGGPNRIGPNLHGVVGRDIASADGFAYSEILKTMPGSWNDDSLNAFLANPKTVAPGTKMAFAGVRKAEDRAALIAYLRSLSPNAPPLE